MLKHGTRTLSIPDSTQGVLTFKSGRKSDGSHAIASITPRGKDFTPVIAENPVTQN